MRTHRQISTAHRDKRDVMSHREMRTNEVLQFLKLPAPTGGTSACLQWLTQPRQEGLRDMVFLFLLRAKIRCTILLMTVEASGHRKSIFGAGSTEYLTLHEDHEPFKEHCCVVVSGKLGQHRCAR